MRIVFYSHMSNLGHGGTESLLAIVSGLAKKHECTVITPNRGSLNSDLTKRGIANEVIPFRWTSNLKNELRLFDVRKNVSLIRLWGGNFIYNKQVMQRHITFIEQLKPNIIYSNTSVINIGLKVANQLKIKHLWHFREFQFLDITPDFGRWYFRKQLSKSDVIIVNSMVLQNFYSNYTTKEKIHMVYNGITTKKIDITKVKKATFRFLIVGTLIEFKGHKDAIMAAKSLLEKGYDFRIDIVGSGMLKKELEALIKSLGLEKIVILHGQRSDVSKFYNNADCYLMCSRVESFGRVTVEAMLYQLPVIGKTGQYSATVEIVRDAIDGFHYKDLNELVLKMEYILKNKNQSVAMGLEGRKRAIKEFSFEVSLQKIEQILLNL